MASRNLNVVTYNIHKGLSQFNRRLVLHEIRDRLRALGADVAFLQEVQGKHDANSRRHVTWPEIAQHEFIAHEGAHVIYGRNAVYQDGHHGNAIVSRHPIHVWENVDVSHHSLESRGLLHCEIEVPGWKERHGKAPDATVGDLATDADLNAEIARRLARDGVSLDAWYHCPHYGEPCECRKPEPGMIRRAAAEYDIDVARSGVVVDRGSDIALANKGLIVAAGELVAQRASRSGAMLLPVDSEHSAIFQCLQGAPRERIAAIVLTAVPPYLLFGPVAGTLQAAHVWEAGDPALFSLHDAVLAILILALPWGVLALLLLPHATARFAASGRRRDLFDVRAALHGVRSDFATWNLALAAIVTAWALETAVAVGSTPGAVRVAQHRALRRLRPSLSAEEVV